MYSLSTLYDPILNTCANNATGTLFFFHILTKCFDRVRFLVSTKKLVVLTFSVRTFFYVMSRILELKNTTLHATLVVFNTVKKHSMW